MTSLPKIILLLFFSMLFFSCNSTIEGEQNLKGYKINGFIKNHDGKRKLKFFDTHAGDSVSEYIIDVQNDGSFNYVGSFEVATPVLFAYVMPDNAAFDLNEKLIVFIEDGDSIYIEADANDFGIAKVIGGENQRIYQAYNDIIKADKMVLEAYLIKMQTEKNAEKLKEVNANYEQLYRQQIQIAKDFVSQHAQTIAGVFIAINALPIEENIPVFEHLVIQNKGKNSAWVRKLENIVDKLKPISIGALAPEIELSDVNGKMINLQSLRGNYLLVDFWASWCVPCRKDHPFMVELYREYQPKGLQILGISVDKERNKWIEAINADKIDWINVHSPNEEGNKILATYQVTNIPHSILIDPDGIIVAKNVRGISLKEKLTEIYADDKLK